MNMQDKVALVTGAALGYSSGGPSIGSAIALKLASEGARVMVVDILEEMGERTAARIRENGGTSLFIRTDVSKTDEVKRAIEMARNVVDISEDDWHQTIDVNLNGYFRFAKYGIPLILQSGGGTIVNMSSCQAFRGLKNFSVYPVTKAAINALTRTLAIDFAPHIRANAICPGFVRIANSEGNRSPEEVEQWIEGIARTYPLKRVCSVDEIANVALFLASDDSSYINGECIIVDGGRFVCDTHEF
jgi:NAD(P)-dependent dehydrogenase (short-subunit alcohol dehydrogenase family)